MPDALENIITFVPYLELASKQFPRRIETKYKNIRLDIRFQDIAGRRHVQKVSLEIDGYAYGEEDHSKNYGHGILTFRNV